MLIKINLINNKIKRVSSQKISLFSIFNKLINIKKKYNSLLKYIKFTLLYNTHLNETIKINYYLKNYYSKFVKL